MNKEIRTPHFANICERCKEINVFPKTDKVPGYCSICGNKALYKLGYITSSEKVEHRRSEGQALGEILEELKCIRKELQDMRSILEPEEKDLVKKTIKQLVASMERTIDSVQF